MNKPIQKVQDFFESKFVKVLESKSTLQMSLNIRVILLANYCKRFCSRLMIQHHKPMQMQILEAFEIRFVADGEDDLQSK